MHVLQPGVFIWTNFPFGNPPDARSRPGPSPHVAYHLGSDAGLALLAYTSSGSWRGAGLATPPGVVEFGIDEAAVLNQKVFHLDLRTLAKVALTAAWFPYWDRDNRGVVAVADTAVQRRILQAAKLLVNRLETIEIRGVGSATTTITRRPGAPRP